MEKNYSCVVDRLKEERIRLNYSQQQVAFCLGMTQSGYNRMEKGLNYLSDYELQCLCETDIDVDYVITGEKRHKEYSYEFERFEINELLDYIYLMCAFLTHEYNRDKAIQDSEKYKSIEMVRFLVRPYKGYENMVYAIRTLLQLSQQEMAAVLGIDVRKLRKMEKGKTSMDSEMLWKLYNLYSIHPGIILRDRGGLASELSRMIGMLPSDKRISILQYMGVVCVC